MPPAQQKALQHLASLTELGRIGQDPSPQCTYDVKGKDNGIQLFQMGVTDADMKSFASLPDWHAISLRENGITDAGFKHLSHQKELRFLDIGETKITSLNPVKGSTHLQKLWCDNLESLTDRKASALKNFHDLQFLDLSYCDTGDATLKRLEGLQQLQKLNLIRTKITDAGLKSIATLPALQMLGLYRTSISDEGLQHLYGMKQLRLLVVGETKVTPAAKNSIQRAIPDLKIADYEGIY